MPFQRKNLSQLSFIFEWPLKIMKSIILSHRKFTFHFFDSSLELFWNQWLRFFEFGFRLRLHWLIAWGMYEKPVMIYDTKTGNSNMTKLDTMDLLSNPMPPNNILGTQQINQNGNHETNVPSPQMIKEEPTMTNVNGNSQVYIYKNLNMQDCSPTWLFQTERGYSVVFFNY